MVIGGRNRALSFTVPMMMAPRSLEPIPWRERRAETYSLGCSAFQPSFEKVGMKRYPLPGTVAMNRGRR